MTEFIKYPKTPQFRDVIREVQHTSRFEGLDSEGKPIYNNNPLPVINFKGTVKVHGTNAGIIKTKEGINFQSRNKIITPQDDNAGFASYMSSIDLKPLFSYIPFEESIQIFGEWCGSNIQKGIAVSNLKEKIFIIFRVIVDGKVMECNMNYPELRIYSINSFPKYPLTVDFNTPTLAQNTIIKQTLEVEERCPVGASFGFEGIGEGVVYEAIYKDKLIFFKSKGEKHSSSRVSTLAQIDPEKVKSVLEFVEYACTENRMNQALENVELNIKNTGEFIKWVIKDIESEESDVMESSGIVLKDVSRDISTKCKNFFFKRLENN